VQPTEKCLACWLLDHSAYIKFEQKSNLVVKTLTFLLVTVVLAKVHGFNLATGWFSSVFSVLAGLKQVHRQINRFGVGFELVRGLRNSIPWIKKWLHRETRAWFWKLDYEFGGSARLLPLLLNGVTTFLTCSRGLDAFFFTSAIQCQKMWKGINTWWRIYLYKWR